MRVYAEYAAYANVYANEGMKNDRNLQTFSRGCFRSRW